VVQLNIMVDTLQKRNAESKPEAEVTSRLLVRVRSMSDCAEVDDFLG